MCSGFVASTWGAVKRHQTEAHANSRRQRRRTAARPGAYTARTLTEKAGQAPTIVEGASSSTESARSFKTCPLCKAQVRPDRIDRHVNRVHSNREKPDRGDKTRKRVSEPSAARMGMYVQSPPPRTTVCPSCRERVLESLIASHQRRCIRQRQRPIGYQRSPRQQGAFSGGRENDTDSKARMVDEIRGQGRRRPIDASPNGRLPRDHGRFGSFPSHDGFGDDDWA